MLIHALRPRSSTHRHRAFALWLNLARQNGPPARYHGCDLTAGDVILRYEQQSGKNSKTLPIGPDFSTVSFSGARQALTVNQARRCPGSARKRTKVRKESPDASRYRGALIEINSRECLALSAVTRNRSSRPWKQLILGSLKGSIYHINIG